ncbi:MAG: helix-turn-helix transcriptional regulator [Rhodospirillaceae bacterium]|jgi:AraC family transcriptional regulator, activator of mtrCDE|nr:helix-turn-helix transcriptional regulator [Rhodospirillaceae bacterium]
MFAPSTGWPSLGDSVVPLLVREMNLGAPGSETVVTRLAEVLLIQVLNRHVQASPPSSGLLVALSDSRLARAIQAIHDQPENPWSLEELAHRAGMSRSSFAERFHDVAGVTPNHYLTHWRMVRARQLLEDTDNAIVQVSESVGYSSELAFARAFQRLFGTTPSRFRRRSRQAQQSLAG